MKLGVQFATRNRSIQAYRPQRYAPARPASTSTSTALATAAMVVGNPSGSFAALTAATDTGNVTMPHSTKGMTCSLDRGSIWSAASSGDVALTRDVLT